MDNGGVLFSPLWAQARHAHFSMETVEHYLEGCERVKLPILKAVQVVTETFIKLLFGADTW